MLPLWARMDLEAMLIKVYSAFKAQALLKASYQIVLCYIQDSLWASYPSTEKQLVYLTPPADWAIEFSVSKVSMIKTVQYQTIQFSTSTQFSSIWPIDRTFSGATTLGQSGIGSDGNEGVLRVPQSSSNTGTSSPYSLVLYQDTHCVSYPSTEKQLVYSTAHAHKAI